ncbi:MAG: TetR/AcrR family transcriptional regulator [Microbacterium sp.]|uniref:TetR/AcrR family transcriptional regulator n=1 Tax=Microbacterium sp. TaxID=51671 RepID=UPI001AC0D701|nr:TetR/AcrR family transcriptional regulator [Microbacterium sp.]MBN9152409.1 TetR/AcrR family transcriptional regulator [Microbacterium sp.]
MSIVDPPEDGSPSTESGRSERRGEARTVAILEAALALIGEVGYERVTMDGIAGRARASKMTMYRRWPTKSDLVAEALRRHAQGDAPAVPDTGTLRGDLLATVAEISRTLIGGDTPSLIGLVEAIRDDPALRVQVGSQIRDRSHQVGREICARANSRGEAVRIELADTVLDIAFEHLFTSALFAGARPSPADQQKLVDVVLLPLLSATEPSRS